METDKVLAQASIVVTKEDIVKHEVDKFVVEQRGQLDVLNKEYCKVCDELNALRNKFNPLLEEFCSESVKNDDKLNNLVAAFQAVGNTVTVRKYDDVYSLNEDGTVPVNITLVHTRDNYSFHSFITKYEVSSELVKIHDEIASVLTEVNVVQGKMNLIQETIHPTAIEAKRCDFMSQIMSAAMKQINGGLKQLLPSNTDEG